MGRVGGEGDKDIIGVVMITNWQIYVSTHVLFKIQGAKQHSYIIYVCTELF